MRVSRSRRQIKRTGTQRCQADAGTSGETPVGGRHETGGLLVSRQYKLDLRAPQRIQHVEILLARNGEDIFDALVFEGGHQEIGAFCHAAETPLALGSVFSARRGNTQSGRMK
jgi:hypothetical protein